MDLGSEGRGLQREKSIIFGKCLCNLGSDLKDRPGVSVVGYVRGPLGGTRVR